MRVRRIRKRTFASLSDQAKTVLGAKLTGSPKIGEVTVSSLEAQDLQAFAVAWNKVQAKCKQAGVSPGDVPILVVDEGRYTAKYQKGRLAVNLTKFSKNPLAAELLAHELGRKFWATNLTDDQRKALKVGHVDPEGYFARTFRTKLFGKPKTERWEEFRL